MLRRMITPLVALAVCGLVLAMMHSASRSIDYHLMVRAMRHMHASVVWASIAATAVSFLALVGRDVGALRYAGADIPRTTLFLGSFCGSALGNAVGFGALSGGAVRYRIYGAAGVVPEQVALIMLFITVGFGVGLVAVAAGSALLAGDAIGRLFHFSPLAVRVGGFAVLAMVAGLLGVCARRPAPVTLGRLRLNIPDGRLALSQVALTAVDVIAAGAALWILLPGARVDFATFSAVFAAATALGVISHVPGGLGVFEAVVVFALGRHISPTQTAAALLTYRAIYFGLPLLLAAMLLAASEMWRIAEKTVPGGSRKVLQEAGQLAPTFLSAVTFAIGAMLVVSGATPAFGSRLALLHTALPLWTIEFSDFLASLTGVVLLFVSRGLFHRLDGAWWLALALATANLVFSLGKGLAIGETMVIACLIVLLLATRRQFTRSASFLGQPFTIGWFVAVSIVVVAAAWILFFAFRDVRYSRELWWQFELDAQAPRAMRALLGATLVMLGGALSQLLRPTPGRVSLPTEEDLERAAAIVRDQDRSDAMLAMMGDKSFLFSASGRSMLMYGKRGRSWVALYDPIGPTEEWPELIWRFVELADMHGGRVAFYEVKPNNLTFYLDAGLKVMKLGEEARVELAAFSTQGSAGSALRYALKRGEREQFDLEIIPPGEAGRVADILTGISDAWLAARKAGEKAFSVAAFTPEFVATQYVALLRQAGQPVAFVTLMTTDLRTEATVGLMRQTPDASGYAMEYIFTRLALYLKDAGFSVFSLGVAPLAGITRTPLSSSWHRVAGVLWRHGGRFYGFKGLRAFKSKFHPTWESRYVAASGSVGPLIALADVVALTGSGS